VQGEYAAPPRSGSLYSEQDWNDTSTAENGQGYHLSKVRTSRACCLEDAHSPGSLSRSTAAGRAELDQHMTLGTRSSGARSCAAAQLGERTAQSAGAAVTQFT